MELIPIKKACTIIGVTYKTLYSWINKNKISYTRIGNRFYMTQEQIKDAIYIYTLDKTEATDKILSDTTGR